MCLASETTLSLSLMPSPCQGQAACPLPQHGSPEKHNHKGAQLPVCSRLLKDLEKLKAQLTWQQQRGGTDVSNAGLTGCCPCQGCLPTHSLPCGSGSAATAETQPPPGTKHTKLHVKVKLSGLLSASEEKPEITFE